jgi:hypothetical protein
VASFGFLYIAQAISKKKRCCCSPNSVFSILANEMSRTVNALGLVVDGFHNIEHKDCTVFGSRSVTRNEDLPNPNPLTLWILQVDI